MQPVFITGIGTDVGKTLAAAIVTEALRADYWKPVQAGFASGTDAEYVRSLLSNPDSVVHDELYRLHTPASPHIAARKDGISIDPALIAEQAAALQRLAGPRPLVIEGAGGLLVPLNGTAMVADLISPLHAKTILVSRNYLGSINHSLLTAAYCRALGLDVAGWIFNDDYLSYEEEIVHWSGYPSLGSIPKLEIISQTTVATHAARLRDVLIEKLL
ncbi:MAG: dethiobiotin synthase [Chitinophagaceae bacterium]|nr:dethiobiotin synthase [Chitinophagaceae bacterium]